MKAYYSFTEVGIARQILADADTLDRFGNPLYPVTFILWAAKVESWFRSYINRIKNVIRNQKVAWNEAVSRVWKTLKSAATVISDKFEASVFSTIKDRT